MMFERAIREDVLNTNLLLVECACDKKRSMTIKRISFSAHYRYAMHIRSVGQTLNTVSEVFCFRQLLIANPPAFQNRRILGSTAKLATEKYVVEAMLLQCGCERVSIELRIETTVGCGANVCQCRNVVSQ